MEKEKFKNKNNFFIIMKKFSRTLCMAYKEMNKWFYFMNNYGFVY